MRLPTISIAGLLLITATLACDMAAFELIRRASTWYAWEVEAILAVVPFFNILVIGLSVLGRQVSLHGEARPFLVGFDATGAIALAAVLIAQLGFGDQMYSYRFWAERHLWAFWHEYIEWTGEFTLEHADSIRVGFDVAAYAGPLLLTAMFGGLCTKREVVTCGPGRALQPDPGPSPYDSHELSSSWRPCFLVQASGVLGSGEDGWNGAVTNATTVRTARESGARDVQPAARGDSRAGPEPELDGQPSDAGREGRKHAQVLGMAHRQAEGLRIDVPHHVVSLASSSSPDGRVAPFGALRGAGCISTRGRER